MLQKVLLHRARASSEDTTALKVAKVRDNLEPLEFRVPGESLVKEPPVRFFWNTIEQSLAASVPVAHLLSQQAFVSFVLLYMEEILRGGGFVPFNHRHDSAR